MDSIGSQASMEERISAGLILNKERKGENVMVGDDGLTIEYIPNEISPVGVSSCYKLREVKLIIK